jgi:hypothetical protein
VLQHCRTGAGWRNAKRHLPKYAKCDAACGLQNHFPRTHRWLLPAFKPILVAKARSLVTELKLGSMYALAQACGDDLLHWIVKEQARGSARLRSLWRLFSAMFEDEDEANAET